jgi:hypothetical protein
MQQRGICPEALEALLDFGRMRHLHKGAARSCTSGKAARKRLARKNPAAAREAERLRRTYAVIGSNGVVITVGYRYPRVARD